MVNDTFSAKRFGQYFMYDLKQLWHNNGKAALALGFISVICYIIWVAFSLIFVGTWQAPGLVARLVFFSIGSMILVFYQTRTYGYLTEKKAGQSWLMVPASHLEKFVSMMIITIIVIPLAYLVSYLVLDSLIGLLDKTSGGPLLGGFGSVMDSVNRALSAAREEGFQFSLSAFLIPSVFQFIFNLLYFLLCGICFKKWKIMGGIGIMLGVEAVVGPVLSSLIFKYWTPLISGEEYQGDPAVINDIVHQVAIYANVINIVLLLAVAVAIYYRIKTFKH